MFVPSAPFDDRTVKDLCHANYLEFARETARWSGLRGALSEADGILLAASASDFPVSSNVARRLDATVPAAAVIAAADAWFGARGRGWSLSTDDRSDGDADLVAEAEAQGLVKLMEAPAMVCDQRLSDRPTPEGVALRIVSDAAAVADLAAVDDAAYQSLGMPAGVILDMLCDADRLLEHHVVAVVADAGDEAVAAALVLLSHGVAGVYYVGTVAAARGLGLADLVTRTVTNIGFDRGAALVTLQASAMGEPIYRRMGYRELYRYTTHTRFV